ncbi:MAG: NADPH:quinone oxidoreductase [Rhodovulum sulfidophilum]|uniref:NADPH:quinone oxidoreductase n=1 Tax=Rhodovulum sulfidophilum TaxID=35806 RepID=A0A2W5N3U6_RHOSU|nr:MAG: NADPH:quinone oxidoreductase [Rhodovulum sulfidophilum]
MKAAVLTGPGAPAYGTVARPEARDGTLLIDVTLAGMNPIDIFLATQPGAGFPRVPGNEGVGLAGGRRVYFGAQAPAGAMAEQALAAPERVYDIPDGLADEMAVALGIGGLTAWTSLTDRAALAPGETVLVLGATGIVGQFAVQAAKLLGAGRVVAAGRDRATLARLETLGADALVVLEDGETPEALAERMRAACAGRLDVVIDPVWGVPAVAALMAATRNGRLVQLGHSASRSVDLAPAFMRGKPAAILGYSSSVAAPETRRGAYADLCAHALAGRLSVPTRRVALSDIAEVWKSQAASPNVKLCVDVAA